MNPTSSTAALGAAEPFFRPDDYRNEQSLLLMLRRPLVALAQRVNERNDLGGSTVPQWVPLYKVYVGDADTVAELARKCTIDPGAMTRLLDRLEAKGLCRRVRSEHDRRVVHIELTPAGEDVARRVPHILSRVYNAVLAGFSADEWQQLQDFLRRVRANAESASTHSREESA